MLVRMGAESHLGIDLADYDSRIRTFIPGYDVMHEAVGDALVALIPGARQLILELGIGTGALAARCLEVLPTARIVGVDEDRSMLEAARGRLGSRLQASLEGNFEATDLPRADAIV